MPFFEVVIIQCVYVGVGVFRFMALESVTRYRHFRNSARGYEKRGVKCAPLRAAMKSLQGYTL